MENHIIATISARTQLTVPALEQLLSQGEGKNVGFALEHGIITEVKPPAIPTGAVNLVLNAPA